MVNLVKLPNMQIGEEAEPYFSSLLLIVFSLFSKDFFDTYILFKCNLDFLECNLYLKSIFTTLNPKVK